MSVGEWLVVVGLVVMCVLGVFAIWHGLTERKS